VHDYFDILGVSQDARASDIRRACCRHSRPAHPDIWDGESQNRPVAASRGAIHDAGSALTELSDTAIDFVDAATLVDRMREAFFTESAGSCASTSTR
jgi:hypothetical protein